MTLYYEGRYKNVAYIEKTEDEYLDVSKSCVFHHNHILIFNDTIRYFTITYVLFDIHVLGSLIDAYKH